MFVFNFFRLLIYYLKIYEMKLHYVSILFMYIKIEKLTDTLTIDLFFLFLDYLLSNNHVNSIIVHKFDFSDEEVMAYYISFLKTLSLKLNGHTIHFFYNEVRVGIANSIYHMFYCL